MAYNLAFKNFFFQNRMKRQKSGILAGRTPIGLSMVPAIKVGSNSNLSNDWFDLIDLDAGHSPPTKNN